MKSRSEQIESEKFRIMITVRLKNEQFEFGKIFSSGQLKLLHYLESENFRDDKSIFFQYS